MLKDSKALELDCYVFGIGAFGIFFRWMQLMLAKNEGGTYDNGFWNFALPVLMIGAAVLYSAFVRKLKKTGAYLENDFCKALRNDGKFYAACRIGFGALMVLGSLLLLVQCETDLNRTFLRILAVIGILSGISFPLVLSAANKPHAENLGLYSFLSFFPILLFGAWLVTCYKQNSISAVGWDYVTEVATASAALLAFFRVASFPFGSPSWSKSVFFCMLGASLCIMSLADSRYIGQQIMLAAAAMMLLMYNWIILTNLKKKKETYVPDYGGFEHLNN